jgi:hypothetical protein
VRWNEFELLGRLGTVPNLLYTVSMKLGELHATPVTVKSGRIPSRCGEKSAHTLAERTRQNAKSRLLFKVF